MSNIASVEKEYIDYTQPETEKERFAVTDMSSAEWCLKRIAWHKKRKAAAEEFVANEQAKLQEYLAKVVSEENGSITYFEELLRPFALQQLDGSRKKSVTLPSGTLSFKKAPPDYQKDDDALLTFVKNSTPEYLKVKEIVNWTEFKKTCRVEGSRLITADGEIVDGVEVVERPDVFTVKVSENHG